LAQASARGSQPPNPAKQAADNSEAKRRSASPKVSYLRHNKQENMVALPRPGSPAPLPGLRRWAPRAPAVGRRRRGRACATWRRPETEPPSADRPQRTPGAPRRWLKPQRNRSDEGKPPYYGQWKRYGLRFVPHEAGLGLTAFKVPSILHLHRPCVAAACFPTWRLLLGKFPQAKKMEILLSN